MPREQVLIRTTDGECPASVFTPTEGSQKWPAVIFYMDGFGIRPVLFDMAQRLSDAGYVVLLPDLFYRAIPYEPLDVASVFASEDVGAALRPLMQSTDNHSAARDTAAFIDHLDRRSDVAGTAIGTVGYCMGGGMSLTAAGMFPDRVAAAASIHGGSLATDSEMSPHLLTASMRARVYVAAADNDFSYPPAMVAALCHSLMDSSVDHCHELYTGAGHGWTMADSPVFDATASERHWSALRHLLDGRLRTPRDP